MVTDNYYDGYSRSEPRPDVDKNDSDSSPPDLFGDYPVRSDTQGARPDSGESAAATSGLDADALESLESATSVPEAQEHGDTLGGLLSELDELIGLQRVKVEVRRLIQYVRIQNMRQARGIARSKMSLHSVFYGSPGTGKTTVARLYGRMLKALGLLSSGHLIETDRSGLVANYIGQTATKTDGKVQDALGGVLFIDEAYALAKGEEARWDFGAEAIEVLMKRMEDHRDDLVVIAAGYPEPMNRFLRSNEGLRSRFSTFVHFDDYTPEEMLKIFQLFCQQENYELDEEAAELAGAAIGYHYAHRDQTFGNARYVRNLFEMVIRNHALRVGFTKQEPSVLDLRLILPEDVPLIIDGYT